MCKCMLSLVVVVVVVCVCQCVYVCMDVCLSVCLSVCVSKDYMCTVITRYHTTHFTHADNSFL